jgi:hypothetical protein
MKAPRTHARGASNTHKKKNAKKGPPNSFFYPKSYFLCDLKLRAKLRNYTITPSGRKVCGREKKKEEENSAQLG